jgi:predicted N-acetyltransferase YhbS
MHIAVRPLREHDLGEADRIFRLAFGTFVGMADPTTFAGDSDWIATRWRADPSAAFAADVDGQLAGSVLATNWGSVGFFGPLTVRPDLWNRGVARRLLEPVMECFTRWGTRHAGLYTFAESPKHVALYQRFGFYPRFLTAIMMKTPPSAPPDTATGDASGDRPVTRFSTVAADDQPHYLAAVGALTDEVFVGLDVSIDMRAVAVQRLGDTLLLWEGSELVGVAVCHTGAGTEAGSAACYVKFAAARPGGEAGTRFERLLDAVERYAASRSVSVALGINLGREDTYRRAVARGYTTVMQGVAMHRPNAHGFDHPDAYVVADWR